MDTLLLECMDSYGKITCSNTKDGKYDYKYAKDAIASSKFIQLGSSRFTKLLSVDIDSHKDLGKVYATLEKESIPKPTYIVETNRGLHLHWVLHNRISSSNLKATYYRNTVNKWLLLVLDGDTRAVGFRRNFRNPLFHKTYYNPVTYSLDDFKVPKQEVAKCKPRKSSKDVKAKSKGKFIDFTKVEVGERHQALFDGLRVIAYKLHKLPKEEIETELSKWANYFNSQLREPQTNAEIHTLVTTITQWVATRYNGSSERTTKFNQNLAKNKANKAFSKVKEGIITLLTKAYSIKNTRELSARAGGRVCEVSKNTFSKYKDKVIQEIIELLKELASSSNVYANNLSESLYRFGKELEKFIQRALYKTEPIYNTQGVYLDGGT